MMSNRDDAEKWYSTLSKYITYEPTTGNLIWKYRAKNESFNTFLSGKIAGARYYEKTAKKWYIKIDIAGVCRWMLAHRVCFLLMTGRWPLCVDHIDGNGENNKWENIREVNHAENNKNRVLGGRSKTGLHGVYLRSGNFRVIARENGKSITLGTFNNIFDAACARKSFERSHGYHPNHGQKPLNWPKVLPIEAITSHGIRIKGKTE